MPTLLVEIDGLDELACRLLLGGIIVGLGIAYACFRVGCEAGSRRPRRPSTMLARESTVWLDGEAIDCVGDVWVERASRR